MKTVRVKKGINLYLNERDKFNTTIFQVDFVFPTNSQYFARLNLLSDLLKKHSKRFQKNQDIIDFLENHYGANFDISYDSFGLMTTFSIAISFVHPRLLNDRNYLFSDFVSFIEEIIFNQTDRIEDLFENEKRYCKNLLKNELTDPEVLMFYQALPSYISSEQVNSPITGTFTQLNALEVDEVYDLWQNIIQTSFINIYYDGLALSADNQRAINKFAKRFFPRSGDMCNPVYYFEQIQVEKKNYEKRRISQHIYLHQFYLTNGVNYRNDKYADWLVFNQLFGGDSESLIFLKIREELGLSYEAFSHLSFGLNCFYVYTTLNTKKFELVDETIAQIIDEIQNQDYSPDLLMLAKKSIKNQLLHQKDGRFYDIAQQQMRFIVPSYISDNQLLEEISLVKANDVSNCAKKLRSGVQICYEGIK